MIPAGGVVGSDICDFRSNDGQEANMPDAAGPMETVRSYINAFNKGEVKAMAALFDASGVDP